MITLTMAEKLAAKFAAIAAYNQIEPEELARRICEDFAAKHAVDAPILFVSYADEEWSDAALTDDRLVDGVALLSQRKNGREKR